MVKDTLEAAEQLQGEGISAEVIDLATLKPYDEQTVIESVAKTGRCVIVHEAARTAGFGTEIAALIAERALLSLLAPVIRVTGYDIVIPLPRLERHMPSVERIVAAALRPSSVESRFEALHAIGLTALVGREEELELLLRRWSKAKTGEGQVVLLSGEAGIGKSRLTAVLLERLATEPHTRLRYFCSPQHTDSAFYPIIAAVSTGRRNTLS